MQVLPKFLGKELLCTNTYYRGATKIPTLKKEVDTEDVRENRVGGHSQLEIPNGLRVRYIATN